MDPKKRRRSTRGRGLSRVGKLWNLSVEITPTETSAAIAESIEVDAEQTTVPVKQVVLFKCDVCDVELDRAENLVYHKRIHATENQTICQYCSREFEQAARLQMHRKIHSVLGSSCNKKFQISAKELARLPKTIREALVLEGVVPIDEPPAVTNSTRDCKSRFYAANRKWEFPDRDRGPPKFVELRCRLPATQPVVDLQLLRPERPAVICYQKTMSKKIYNLLRTGALKDTKVFRCFICAETFTSRSNLVCHANVSTDHEIVFDSARRHLCLECGEMFAMGKDLKSHLAVHDGELERRLDDLLKLGSQEKQ